MASRNEDPALRRRAREQAVDWLLRMDEAPLADAERESFNAWMKEDPLHARSFSEVRALFGISGKALAAAPEETRAALSRRSGSKAKLVSLALVLFALAFWAFDGPLRLSADALTETAQSRIVTLADGSRVHLNASSAIDIDLGARRRDITLLRGEAFFEVAPDATRPFLVRAGAGEVRVLGTAFNVNMMSSGVEVTVAENTVGVATGGEADYLPLSRGERVAYDSNGVIGAIRDVRHGEEAPWRTGRLVFEERALASVVEEMNRYLPGRMVVIGTALRKRRISGSFDLSDPEAALASFRTVFGLRTMRMAGLVTAFY